MGSAWATVTVTSAPSKAALVAALIAGRNGQHSVRPVGFVDERGVVVGCRGQIGNRGQRPVVHLHQLAGIGRHRFADRNDSGHRLTDIGHRFCGQRGATDLGGGDPFHRGLGGQTQVIGGEYPDHAVERFGG